jgi:hydroxymethylpyrimidine/phosphomethylpyrimidine kinase
VSRQGHQAFTDTRIATRHSHGTGCTLSSALACGLGQGMNVAAAAAQARAFVRQGLERAPGLGSQPDVGHGPLGFFPLP